MRLSIHGIRNSSAPRNTINLGIALNAESWIEVTIWIKLMTIAATKPMSSSGALTQSAVMNISRTIWTTEPGVIVLRAYGLTRLFISDPTIKFQPSIRTNRSSLNGADIIAGGN